MTLVANNNGNEIFIFEVSMMKENKYYPGDRIQVIECKDPYHPLLPGETGTIEVVDSLGTLHCRWNSGRRFGVCLEEDEIRKIPIDQEWELLHTTPVMQCDETQFEAHCEEVAALFEALDTHAFESKSGWVIRSSFIDRIHAGKEPTYEFMGIKGLDDLIQRCDIKQGIDIAFTPNRPEKERSLLLIAYGGNCSRSGINDVVTEVLECKLVSPDATRDFEERIQAGWDMKGDAAERLFCSPSDHKGISACIREYKAMHQTKSKDADISR